MKKKLFSMFLASAMTLSFAACAMAADRSGEILISLSDSGVTVDGQAASADSASAVYIGGDIIYYEDGTDASYGEGTAQEMHSAQEAAAHTVVTITQPGTYRLTGSLSAGQVFVDLGEGAKTDPSAVVTLILDNVDITCTVAPAVFFYRVYECDQQWVAYDEDESAGYVPSPLADTSDAGANVIVAAGSENHITGSHVARIYKEGTTKKLHKYDGAFYSRMSMNINGDGGDDTGVLNITADNEGLDSELHLTINGGTINIQAQDDGINTNEDGVSVTTVNGGFLTVNGGLGAEGDGIDSNGYLVINGGTIWTMSNETSPDGGIDADMPILIHGGTLYGFGTRNDAVSSDSQQPYMELSFASTLPAGSVVTVTAPDGTQVWTAVTRKACQSLTLTTPGLELDVPYQVYVDGVLQCYSGTGNMSFRPGNFGGGGRPGDMLPPGDDRTAFELPDGERPSLPTDDSEPFPMPSDGEEAPQLPADGQRPHDAGRGPGGMGGSHDQQGQPDGSGSTDFTLTESTKSFSGICDSDSSGKTRVSFTVNGVSRTGTATVISKIYSIVPSVDGLEDEQIQVTVTDDPSEDYAASCLLSDGLEAVNALLPSEDGDYILTVAVVNGVEGYTGATQVSFTVGALPFSDVRESDPAYASIRYLYEKGCMTGTGEDRFSPNATLTRAQAVTVLARLAGAQSSESSIFSDVEANSWYSGYVGWAVDNGIVEGDGQGRFLPEAPVTADQLELMLSRYAALTGADYTPITSGTQPLTRSDFAVSLHAYALTTAL